jgi:hypothetical protein
LGWTPGQYSTDSNVHDGGNESARRRNVMDWANAGHETALARHKLLKVRSWPSQPLTECDAQLTVRRHELERLLRSSGASAALYGTFRVLQSCHP